MSLDRYGIDWYNPQSNIELKSSLNILILATFNRRYSFIPSWSPNSNIYSLFSVLKNNIEACFNLYLFPIELITDNNLTERINLLEDRGSDENDAQLASRINSWGDLELITGEDLSVFYSDTINPNSVWDRRILTKTYKILGALKYRFLGSPDSHIIGEVIDVDTFSNYYTGATQYVDDGVSSLDYADSYSDSDWDNIYYSAQNSYNEFISNLSRRGSNKIELTVQKRVSSTTPPYTQEDFSPPSSKKWGYFRRRGFISGTSLKFHSYGFNKQQSGYNIAPLRPKFARGDNTNYYRSRTEVYINGSLVNSSELGAVESFYIYRADDGADFGTGLSLFDTNTLPYVVNENGTMQTDVFAEFNYDQSDFPYDPNMEYENGDPPNYSNGTVMNMGSYTYYDMNNPNTNEYAAHQTEPSD